MIYICIPTHNEQQTVGVVLWKLRQVFQDFPRDYQLLVADDASTDKTAEVLEPYTRVLPLTVIHCERQQGYAASMEMLLREAVRRSEYPKRDVIVTLQADFSEEPDDLVPLLKRMEAGADVTVGNKISKSKDTRMRRLSRKLAGFFLRGAKWPDGVETPFDGYRAYRLHAIKRAIEEGGGKRVLHFDSWAGHAQLLRAVLPHARRIDVVDVVERADRLQRPRREQPFAAAFQVRALASGKEPQGLTGVEELDRIAATASRSRAQSRITQQSSRPASGNGKREESRRPGSGDGRTRQRDSAPRGEAPRRGEADRSRTRSAPAAGEDATRRQGRPARGATAAATEEQQIQQRRKRGPKPEATAPQTVQAPLDAAAVEPKAKKKRRRRRKKSAETNVVTGAAPETAPAGAPAGLPVVEADATAPDSVMTMEADAEVGAEAAVAGEATGAPERKRRRRGGRRGGRGRRKGRTEGAAAEGAVEGAVEGATAAESDFGEGAAAETSVNERAASRAGGMIAEEGSATAGVSDGGNSTPAAPVESAPTGSDND